MRVYSQNSGANVFVIVARNFTRVLLRMKEGFNKT